MPGLKTYTDGKNIYSVDMMLAYVNSFDHPVVKLPMEDLLPQLEKDVWGWSPSTVLAKMDVKKYSENATRIRDADLSYPIFVPGEPTSSTGRHTILEGYHRVAKASLEGKTDIKAYVFDAPLMRKFILNSDMNFVQVHQHTPVYEILELWTKRFCKH